jgi:hypothetical protein
MSLLMFYYLMVQHGSAIVTMMEWTHVREYDEIP